MCVCIFKIKYLFGRSPSQSISVSLSDRIIDLSHVEMMILYVQSAYINFLLLLQIAWNLNCSCIKIVTGTKL